jgi:hypothetical protein
MDAKELGQIITIVERLSQEYHHGRLALFVGSGVSKGCGLPELNLALSEEYLGQNFQEPLVWGMSAMAPAIRSALAKLPLPITARYLRRKLGEDYYPALRRALYKQSYRILRRSHGDCGA